MPRSTQALVSNTTLTPKPRKRPRTHLYCYMRDEFLNTTLQWKALSGVQKSSFAVLGTRMAGLGAKNSERPMTGYQCFMSLNISRRAQLLPMLFDAPSTPDSVPYLGNVTLTATSARPDKPLPSEFHLTVNADPIDCPVQVMIAAPSACLLHLPPESKYKSVGVINGIGPNGADITALYLTTYAPLGYAYKIAVRLVPLSPLGFRGQPVMVMGTVAGVLG